jgi:hypothetical protein
MEATHIRAGLYNFDRVNFLFYASLVLTADKATVKFRSSMKYHTKHYSLLAVKSGLFSHHINCFSGRMGRLLRLLSCKLLHMWRHQRITGISAYFDYMRVADTIDSQKSEDHDITDKLL